MSKIQPHHLEKAAYVYLRQSTMAQVLHHQQSTERQYALEQKARQLGWPPTQIRVLDRDLGQSAAQSGQREDFNVLVTDVSMQKIGAIFTLEASRLSRCGTDWTRLVELCALTGTLIIDEDGIYNPCDFNDQLLLGLKGTLSQAELHLLRARLQGGKLHKAQKGELRFPLPVGYCFDERGQIVLDPDQEVRHGVHLIFRIFRQKGTAYAVMRHFSQQQLLFPKRAYGGAWDGKLIWGRLTHSRVLAILKNPTYAGAYVYGRYRSVKKLSEAGTIQTGLTQRAMDEWLVRLNDHHEGYITWEQFLEHQEMLKKNRPTPLAGPLREGLALLQGLLICGHCGRRITIRYQGNGGIYPTYQCNWRKREGLSTTGCLSVRAEPLDEVVTQRVLEVLEPAQLELAIEAFEELAQRRESSHQAWKLHLERARYEVDLAQRRYEAVDPENRLVAATLERQWNQALERREDIHARYEVFQAEDPLQLDDDQKQALLRLSKDLPRLWAASSTSAQDKKRILRLLIKDITVERAPASKQVRLHVRWQGGACEELVSTVPPRIQDRLRYSEDVIAQVRALAQTHLDNEIADRFNRAGRRSATGKVFTASMIKWIRHKHRIAAPRLKRDGELTVQEVAARLQVSTHVVYYWIARGYLGARRVKAGSPYWIPWSAEVETRMHQRVTNSTKIAREHPPHS